MSTIGVTAIVPTWNEADNLPACLDSLAWADEVIVIDSHSTDGTCAIARARGARVVEHEFRGYGEQRNRAVDAASHDWVLCVDADERVTPGLQREIRSALARTPAVVGFRLRRRTWVAGYPIRRCGWQDDRVLRLYDRRQGKWDGRLVHERVILNGLTSDLGEPLDHHTARDLASFVEKSRRYAVLGASEMQRSGRSAGPLQIAFHPLARMFKMYLLKAGFLDGIPGLFVCVVGAYGVFLKYALVWDARRRVRLGADPTPTATTTTLEPASRNQGASPWH